MTDVTKYEDFLSYILPLVEPHMRTNEDASADFPLCLPTRQEHEGDRNSVEGSMRPDDHDEMEFDNPLEEEIPQIEVRRDERTLFTECADPEIDSLYRKWKKGRLLIQPGFQRHFVWDDPKASKLIESALLEIPLPVIYLSEERDGKEHVIDGQQRLTSFFSFIDGKFPDGREFRLTAMKVFTELVGQSYKELSDDLQERIRCCHVRTITFKKESVPDLKFEVFERLNTGSVSLNDQELRNCIYRGDYNDLLVRLSADSDFVSLVGLKKPDKRMRDVELVLRFAAFYHATYLKYKPPMRTFLNDDAEKYRFATKEQLGELERAFKNSCQIVRSLLGNNAFKRFYKGTDKNPNGYWEPKKFNASLYDVLMNLFVEEDKNTVFRNLDSIREALIHLMTDDQEFIDAIELSTSSVQAIRKRFDKWRLALQELIGVGKKEDRCFSLALKQELFNSNPTCTICNQRIQEIDDSAVDHIKQYWTGGQTIPSNARLTHRYCNWARSRKE